MTRSTNGNPCTLIPMNLHDPLEFEVLSQQRVICGWNYEPKIIAAWREMMDQGLKSLFWISLPDGTRAGHISLDSADRYSPDDTLDLELANPDRSVMTITTFFIRHEYRSGGLGRAAMDILEDYATQEPYGSPHCRAITVNTLSRKYYEDDAEEWRGIWKRLVGRKAPPRGRSNEDWYHRRGYVTWKEIPKYKENRTIDGSEITFLAVFMRKELQPRHLENGKYNKSLALDGES